MYIYAYVPRNLISQVGSTYSSHKITYSIEEAECHLLLTTANAEPSRAERASATQVVRFNGSLQKLQTDKHAEMVTALTSHRLED